MKETNLNNTLNYYFEEINIKHIALHMIYKFEIQMHRKYSLFDAWFDLTKKIWYSW